MILAPLDLKGKRFFSSSLEILNFQSHQDIKNQRVFFQKHTLIFVLQGEKILSFQTNTFHLQKNQGLLISKGSYTFSNITHNQTYHALLFFFEDDFEFPCKPTKIQTPTLESFQAHHLVLHFMQNLILQEEALNLQDFLTLKAKELILLLSLKHPHHLSYFLNHIQKPSLISQIHQQDFLFESVHSMAKNFKISPALFSKKFKEQMGISPKEWLDTMRLSQAKTMLLLPDKSISEIASELNFSSSTWFIKRFKKNFGLTPKQYQKQAKNFYF